MDMQYDIQLNRDYAWQMKRPHFHEGYEMVLVISGEGNFFIGERMYPLRRGILLLLSDTVLHRSNINAGSLYERYILHFSDKTLAEISTAQTDLRSRLGNASRRTLLDEGQLAGLTTLLERCRNGGNQFGDDLRRGAAFLELMLMLCHFLEPEGLSLPPAHMAQVAPILEYIRVNLAEPLPLDRLTEEFFISKHHLCRIFKAATGFAVGEYIIQYRILKARNLLREGMAVQSAGEAAGFRNNAHFIRTFRTATGESPGRYARRCRME